MPNEFALEVELVINAVRVLRVDAVMLTPEQIQRQAVLEAARRKGKGRRAVRFGRLRVPPALVIESLSLNHEDHDAVTKRGWYAGFGIENYWLLDPFRHTLECLRLEQGVYRRNVSGSEADELRPSYFSGLNIELVRVWL